MALLCAGEIGYRCLRAVLNAHAAKIVAVFSYQVEPPQDEFLAPTRNLCERNDIQFHETANAGQNQFEQIWKKMDLDYIFAIKWRTKLPAQVIDSARGGLIIFHGSLLPKYRGFAPVNWPLINDEPKTGVTMFYAAEDVDAGDIIEQRERQITDQDDAGTIDNWLNETVAQMLVDNLPRLAAGSMPRAPQDHCQATYAIWRSPEDGHIDWNQSTRTIFNLIRGLTHPYPGAYSLLDEGKLIIWSAEIDPHQHHYVGNIPGKVERIIPGRGVNVLTADGVLRIRQVQLAGQEPKNAADVIGRLKTRLR